MDQPPLRYARTAPVEEVKSYAFGFLIAGGLCLYFGFTWVADAPISVADPAPWFLADNVTFWALRITGVLFLAAAALAALERVQGLLLGAASDVLLVVVLLGMSVLWTVEARIAGGWNPQVILLLVLMVLSAASARRNWIVARALRSAPAEAAVPGP